jgi:bifunctional DNA-binding transcriptional regulator/antitoxin component of YhaV-PrlF toxin-antitoxin module
MQIDIASVSSKGQFTITRKYRDLLNIGTGSKLVIVCDGKHLLLKPIRAPQVRSFTKVIRRANQIEKQADAHGRRSRKGGGK